MNNKTKMIITFKKNANKNKQKKKSFNFIDVALINNEKIRSKLQKVNDLSLFACLHTETINFQNISSFYWDLF